MIAPSPKIIDRPEDRQTALIISPAAEDHEVFGEFFQRHGWVLEHANSVHSGWGLLDAKTPSLVITEANLGVGNWKDVLEAMQSLTNPPLVIVFSRLADEHLWAEALNLGAYDVLAKPFDQTELGQVLRSAWTHCQKRPRALALAVGSAS